MPSEIQKHLQTLSRKDRATFLGRLSWFTVEDGDIDHSDVETALEACGLDGYVPKPPQDDDVFRRVFRNGERRTVDTAVVDVKERLLVREVVRKDGRILKKAVVETVNAAGESLSYREVADIRFDVAHPDWIEFTFLEMHDDTRELLGELQDRYVATRGKVTGQAIRDVIRRVMENAVATSVRPGGGVYFVPEDHADLVLQLEAAAEKIPGAFVHTMPVIDDQKQRDMVRRAFEDESVGEIGRIVDEIVEYTKKGEPITMSVFTQLAARRARVETRAGKYAGVLETAMSSTDRRLEVLKHEMSELYKLVAKGAAA